MPALPVLRVFASTLNLAALFLLFFPGRHWFRIEP